jgi:hypothetical protein
MSESFISLAKNINGLVSYIENHEKSKGLLNQLQGQGGVFQREANLIAFNKPSMKVFEYNCYIISLYGYFEQFIESTLTEYIDALSSLHLGFNELPNEIKQNNIKKNTDLLNNLDLPKYRGVQGNTVIATLHDNAVNNKTKINTIAFGHHSANFRINSICEYFKAVGVNSLGKDVSVYEPLKTHLSETFGDYSRLELTTIYDVIDELVERRNAVAHGTIQDEILNTNRVVDMCKFIEKFSESLSSYLNTLIFKRLFDEKIETGNKNFQKLHKINVVNNSILCINSKNLNISLGDKIIVKSLNVPEYEEATIQSIQIKGTDVGSVTSEQSIDIGLGLDKKIKNSNSFYMVI